ncbi:MAG: hypothetical protein ACHQWU_07615 [Gemmatimonadales bacterium]
MRSRHSAALVASFAAATIAAAYPSVAGAQRVDTSRTSFTAGLVPRHDSLTPPISPRRALIYGLLAPGAAQSVLGRHKAAAAFALMEALSIGMIRESAADVHEAKRFAHDTIVVSYIDQQGNALEAPAVRPPQFDSSFVKSRRAHVEDWVALLVANHLFSGADAFVSANLWDVRAHIALRAVPNGAVLGASLEW